MDHWAAQPRSTPGGQSFYSDLAIEVSLMLPLVFGQPLRQTEGLMASIFALLGVDLKVPDHSTVSRRAMSLESISKRCALPAGPAHPDRQHRAEGLRRGRVVAGKAWPKVTPWLEKTAPGSGRQHWVDIGLGTDRARR